MPVAVDSTNNIVRFISKKAILSKERILNTDGKTTFLGLTDKITLNYTLSNRLYSPPCREG